MVSIFGTCFFDESNASGIVAPAPSGQQAGELLALDPAEGPAAVAAGEDRHLEVVGHDGTRRAVPIDLNSGAPVEISPVDVAVPGSATNYRVLYPGFQAV